MQKRNPAKFWKIIKNFKRSAKIYPINRTDFSFDPIYIRFENHKSNVNTPTCRVLIWDAQYFACFSRFLHVKRLFQKIDSIDKSLTHLSYSNVIRIKMFVLKGWVFLLQLEIVNQRRRILYAIESNAKGNDDFATKVIKCRKII